MVVFGPQGYGRRQGLLMVPARMTQAVSPWVFGMALDHWGANALVVSASIGVLALLALFTLPNLSGAPASERASAKPLA